MKNYKRIGEKMACETCSTCEMVCERYIEWHAGGQQHFRRSNENAS